MINNSIEIEMAFKKWYVTDAVKLQKNGYVFINIKEARQYFIKNIWGK